jgi:hypothetical protein
MTSDAGAFLAQVYAEVGERGPLAASELSDPGERTGNWWGWGRGKAALEYLYDAGLVAIAGRRGFTRLYDLSERVIPLPARSAPPVAPEEAMKRLICLATKALGVGTFADITEYFKTDGWHDRWIGAPPWERTSDQQAPRAKTVARRLVAELVEEGRLLRAQVEGWREPAYTHPEVQLPHTVEARALVTPFDSLVWERRRLQRLFDVQYTIELYTPVAKRVFGYYVFLFLLGDTIVARCDLKADRQHKVLLVQSAFLERGQDGRRVAEELAGELRQMQAWLELDQLAVMERGDLAVTLRQHLGSTPPKETWQSTS